MTAWPHPFLACVHYHQPALCAVCHGQRDDERHAAGDTEPVYPGGGLAFTELRPTAGAVLAEPANDAQDMGTYDGWPVAGVTDFLTRDREQRAGGTDA